MEPPASSGVDFDTPRVEGGSPLRVSTLMWRTAPLLYAHLLGSPPPCACATLQAGPVGAWFQSATKQSMACCSVARLRAPARPTQTSSTSASASRMYPTPLPRLREPSTRKGGDAFSFKRALQRVTTRVDRCIGSVMHRCGPPRGRCGVPCGGGGYSIHVAPSSRRACQRCDERRSSVHTMFACCVMRVHSCVRCREGGL